MDDYYNIPLKKLDNNKIPFEVLKYVPFESALNYLFVPISVKDGVLEVGMVNPDNSEARDALQFIASKVRMPFKIYLISKKDFDWAIKSYKGLSGGDSAAVVGDIQTNIREAEQSVARFSKAPQEETTKSSANIVEEAPISKIVTVIVQNALSGGASDIHIEPTHSTLKVRFRVDGVLYTSLTPPMTVHEAMVARIKILSNLKLDEKRVPQDGRFSYNYEGRKADFRVSTLPTYWGEKIVMRILDPEKRKVDLNTIGMSPEQQEIVTRALKRPYGLILITGPTGSGKTTTLYAMLNMLDREKNNVVSLEDPIEYDMPGVSQSQVRPEINYTFANGLRSILRQDPDIVMVGEMRDKETARLAIQASLTGHLVLSTLHTNNSIGAIPRLIDMGVEPYLLPPTLVLMMAQRLVPTICDDARISEPADESIKMIVEKQFADLPQEYHQKIPTIDNIYRIHKTASCPSGTKGRTGVFEFLEMDRELERIVLNNPNENEIYRYARSKGFLTMKEDLLIKSLKGTVPFEEVNKL
ncbi:MAG: GspE/PulE family protein [Candidatus Paceibacterota bacterium]|jgi:type II secretory ATPase GspE/PulE/Tfp pilus assembly ATPase PilB-like protein